MVIVSHTPPYEVLDRGIRFASLDEGSHHIGSTSLRKFIENSDVVLVVCGHCHSHGGLSEKIGGTTVVNVSSHDSIGSVGKFAIIELRKNRKVEIEWYDTNELSGEHSLNRIWGIGPTYSKMLNASGLININQLAANQDLDRLSQLSGISSKLLNKFQLRARSIVENKIFKTSEFEFPEEKLIYIDIETDLVCERVWLIGLLVDNEFIQLYADNWDEEKEILSKFLEILKKHPEHKLVSYSGTDFDCRVPLKALKRHGLDINLLKAHDHFDLSYNIRKCFIFPNQSFALKNLGAFLKYQFKFPHLDGRIVAIKYLRHVEDGKPLDGELIKYNEDDVRVLPFIISTLKSYKLKPPDIF